VVAFGETAGGFGWLLEALGNAVAGLVAGMLLVAVMTGVQRLRRA
jgi:predicted DNA repair protein MutK